MTTTWQHKRVQQAKDLEDSPPEMPAAEVQQWCNFIVWIPNEESGYRIERSTVRREAPPGRIEGITAGRTPWTSNNPSAYRYEVAMPKGRIRVKEFLYDWAFPATDHPSLWNSKTKPVQLNEDYVLWLGTNYYKQQAASARLSRTMIEVGIVDGIVSDDEIVAFFKSLAVVDENAAKRISATLFCALSYWARYKADLVGVPAGLWVFQREPGPPEEKWTEDVESALKILKLPPVLGGFTAECIGVYKDAAGHTETEICYTGDKDRGHELRLVAQQTGKGRIAVPPNPEPHPQHSETIAIHGLIRIIPILINREPDPTLVFGVVEYVLQLRGNKGYFFVGIP